MKASALGITQSSLQQNHFLFPSVQKHPVYQDRTDEPKVVFGPVAEVDGHPVKLELAGLYGLGFGVAEVPSVQGITMLYRRFKAEQLVNDDIDSAELHTLQLLPTYTKGIKLVYNDPCCRSVFTHGLTVFKPVFIFGTIIILNFNEFKILKCCRFKFDCLLYRWFSSGI